MRFRVGPVRFGGGRKASFTAGLGPFGVTVGGGRRKRVGSGGGSSPVQVIVTNWNELSFADKLHVPLKEMRHVIATSKSLPAEDQAIIFFKRRVSEEDKGELLVAGAKYLTPWLCPIVSFYWLDAVVLAALGYVGVAVITALSLWQIWRYKRISQLQSPTEKQLRAWVKVDDSANSSRSTGISRQASSEALVQEIQRKFGSASTERLVGHIQEKSRYRMSSTDGFTLQMRVAMYGTISIAVALFMNRWAFDFRCTPQSESYRTWNCDDYQTSEQMGDFLRTYLLIPFLVIGVVPELLLKRHVHVFDRLRIANSWLMSRLRLQTSMIKSKRDVTRATAALKLAEASKKDKAILQQFKNRQSNN